MAAAQMQKNEYEQKYKKLTAAKSNSDASNESKRVER